jgi:type I restriction enzyme S subunit
MELKPGYKQTEVGVIPDDWAVCDLQDVVALQRGHDLTWRERRPGIYPVMGSAGQNGFHNVAIAKGPGVILGRSGASFGQAHYCDDDFWPHNTAMFVTDFIGNDRRFIFYFLRAFDFSRHNSGGAQQSLNRNFIARIKVPIPPLPEQQAIAQALSDMDSLISGLDDLIAKKRDIKQATMQQLLTGKTRLPGFSGDWEVKRLGDVADFENGDRGSNYPSPSAFRPSGIPFINAGNLDAGRITVGGLNFISKEAFDRLGGGKVQLGDILFCLRGSIGKFGVVTTTVMGGAIASSLVIVRPLDQLVCNQYVCCYFSSELCSKMIEYWAGGAAQPNLGANELRKFEIPIPRLPEQKAIAMVLTDMDDELTALEQRREKTRKLKQAMMQELLTGKTRLV